MNKYRILIAITLASITSGAFAAVSTPAKSAYDAAKKDAAIRYAEDRALCAEETTSTTRMQCLRDAKAEYSKSLTTVSETYNKAKAAAAAPATKAAVCKECGKVSAVNVVEKQGESTPLGMIAGGVAGAVLGHQVGGGRGKDLATIAGAAGGAYAGHKIEQNVRSAKTWSVSVRFENGEERSFSFDTDPGYKAGDAVKAAGNTIVKR